MDRERAHNLIASQFPEIPLAGLEQLGSGWDNDVWLVDGWAFRFPRRPFGVEAIETEMEVLPWLAPRLPLPIPLPRFLGEPADGYPSRFYGHRKLCGHGSDNVSDGERDEKKWAGTLAGFLKSLHQLKAVASRGVIRVPHDRFRSDLNAASSRALQLFDRIEVPSLSALEKSIIVEELTAEVPGKSADPEVFLHGDLYSRHLLIDDEGNLSGVIDWGDCCTGEVALDLAVAYSWLGPAAREVFFREYGEVRDSIRQRARRRALANHGVSLLCFACHDGNATLEMDALRAIRCCLSRED